jgi:hypothetical protein
MNMADQEKPPGAGPSPEELWAEITAIYYEIGELCLYKDGAFFRQLPEHIKKSALIANSENVEAEDPQWKEGKDLPALKERLENLYAILLAQFQKYTGQKPN